MSKILFDWLTSKLEQFPLMTILLGVALAAAWMTEIHLVTQQTHATVHELSQEVQARDQKVWSAIDTNRETISVLLRSIDQRLSRIEGKLEK